LNNQWNEKYADDRFYYGKTPNLHFKEEIDKLEPGKLLLPAEGEEEMPFMQQSWAGS
jgi:hypothetical protein